MKKLAIFALVLTVVSSTLVVESSKAAWQKSVICNNGGLVVDTQMVGSARAYQLVLRDAKAVERFVEITHLGPSINEAGELVLAVSPVQTKARMVKSFYTTLPISSSRDGFVEDLSADLDAYGTFVLNIVNHSQNGSQNINLWNFYHCQSI